MRHHEAISRRPGRAASLAPALSLALLGAACSNLERSNPLDLDPDPPRVVTTDPPAGAQGVDPATNITIFFSEPIDPASIKQETAITVEGPTDRVTGTIQQLANPAQIQFRPDAPLALSTAYQVGVDRAIRDVAGNPMGERWAYTFIFATAKDTTPPHVVTTEPAHGATATIDTAIAAVFDEDLDQTTVTQDGFLVNGPFGSVDGAVSYDQGERRAVFSPNEPLLAGQRYTAMITPGVKDVDGNSLLATVSWSFTTEDDTVGPGVVSLSPSRDQTGVPVDTTVVAVFDEPLNALTVNDRSFTLEYYDSDLGNVRNVVGTVGYIESTRSAIFSPLKALAPNITYTATLTIDLQDLAGNPPRAGTTSWSFSTSSAADTIPPVVLSTQPPDGAGGVATTLTLKATFNEAVLATTVNASTFTLVDVASGTAVPGEVSYDAPTQTGSFRPAAALKHSASYRATVTTGVTDLAGNAMTQNHEFAFGTAADTTPPTVLESFPENGAHDVSVHATVSLFYSEALAPATVIDANLFLESGGQRVAGALSYDAALHKVTFEPDAQLSYDTTYLFTATTGIADLSGNAPAVNRTIAFTTQVSPDIAAPTLRIESPADNAQVRGVVTITGTASDDYGVARVEVDFDNQGNFVPAQSTASWQFVWDTESGPYAVADGQHLITARALDHTGNVQSATVRVSVVNDAPVVLATVPTDLANGVPVTTAIQVDFDRAIALASAQTPGAVRLVSQSEADREIAGTVELKSNDTKLIFHPAETLKYNTISSPVPVSYRFVATTAIEDTAGRAMKQDYAFSFTTEASPDRASPLVVISSPVNGERVLGEVTIEGTASDDFGLREVAVAFDGVNTFHHAEGLGVWVYTWDTSDPATGPTDDGTHVISVRATDTSDNTQFATVVVELVNGQPTVLATSPADNAAGVSVDTVATATFDRPMDLASLLGAVTLTELTSATLIPGQVTLTPDGRTVIFTPDDRLLYNTPERTRYELRITTDAQDQNGFPLQNDFYFRFATEDDLEPPVTTLLNPPGDVIDRDWYVFEWEGRDNADDAADLLYSTRLDNAEFSPFSSRTSATFIDLEEGLHVFQVKALDRSNNEERAYKGVTFTVDDLYPWSAWLYFKDVVTWDDREVFFRKVGDPVLVVIGAEYEYPSASYHPELNGTAWVDLHGLESGITLYDDQTHGDFAGYNGHYSTLYTPPDTGETEYRTYTAQPFFLDQAGREPLSGLVEQDFGISPNWGGQLNQDTVLTAADNPVILDGDLVVPDGVTLTVEAGVEILAREIPVFSNWEGSSSRTEIIIDGGTLVVSGTEAEPVVMRSQMAIPDAEAWGGIVLVNGATARLQHLELRDAYLAFDFDGSSVELFDHVTVEHCRAGFYLEDPVGSVTITNSAFRDIVSSCCSGAGTAIHFYSMKRDYDVTVEDCTFERVTSALYYTKSSTEENALFFRRNTITDTQTTGSYSVGVYSYYPPDRLVFEDNTLVSGGPAYMIRFYDGAKRVEILGNTFVGTAAASTKEAGIYFSPYSTYYGDFLVQGNVFSHLGGYDTASWSSPSAAFHCDDEFEGTLVFDHNTVENCGMGIYTWDLSGELTVTNNIFANTRGSAIHSDYTPVIDPVISNNVTFGTGDYFFSGEYDWEDFEVLDPSFPGADNRYSVPPFFSETDRPIPGTGVFRIGDYRLVEESVPEEYHTISDRVALSAVGGYSNPVMYNDGSGGWILYDEGVDFAVVGDALVDLGGGIGAGDWLCLGYDWAGPWVYLTETLAFSGDPAAQTLALYSLAGTLEVVSVEDEGGATAYAETTDWTLSGTTLERVDGGGIPEDGVVAVTYRYRRAKTVDNSSDCPEWAVMGADGVAPLPQRLEILGLTVTDQTGATTYVEGVDYDVEGYEIVRSGGGAIGDGQMIRVQYSYRSPLYEMDGSGGEVGANGAP